MIISEAILSFAFKADSSRPKNLVNKLITSVSVSQLFIQFIISLINLHDISQRTEASNSLQYRLEAQRKIQTMERGENAC